MEVRAHAKFIRMSPRKVKLIADLIRGLDVVAAETQLRFAVKEAKEPVLKLLKSAIANAENNFNLKKDNLFVKTIYVNEGPVLKRWTPKAFGRAGKIIKRMCHISIVLGETVPGAGKKDVVKSKAEENPVKAEEKKVTKKTKEVKTKTVKK